MRQQQGAIQDRARLVQRAIDARTVDTITFLSETFGDIRTLFPHLSDADFEEARLEIEAGMRWGAVRLNMEDRNSSRAPR